MENKFIVSSSPHLINRRLYSAQIMWLVTASLIPTGIIGIFIFGVSAAWLIVVCVASCVAVEAAIQKMRRQPVTIADGSAVLTGLLLAYNLSSTVPLWLAVVGSVFAIAIAKQAFGGLGHTIFNPALAGRVFLLSAWPKHMTTFAKPFDVVTSATPLALIKEGKMNTLAETGSTYLDLFIGNRGGCLGEVCVAALLVGAAYLLYKRLISWHIPFSYLATVAVMSWIFGSRQGLFGGDVLFHLFSGGLILGAFFMATDYVTSPFTYKGHLVFGIGCGVLTSVIRFWGGYPEGVSYAILMMNIAVPLIDRWTRPRRYGMQ